ncbi:MAG TPA: hypothetical protein VMO26_03410 [Vicinamibacterales bacterium]|nr:hypothetical protein [Vicinamibacterales bacterium]
MTDREDEITRAYIEAELPAVEHFCRRHGLGWTCDLEHLRAELTLRGPGANEATLEEYLAMADLTKYRAMPPWWRMVDPRTKKEIGPAGLPNPTRTAFPSSIFHGSGVLCAPWNRGAYKQMGGPHDNWGDASAWEQVRGTTIALTLGEMVDRIYRETQESRGRLAPLPALT